MKELENFSANLKFYMEENNLSIKGLAKACNLHTTTVSNWLKCVSEPKLTNLSVISKYFGITIDDLISD